MDAEDNAGDAEDAEDDDVYAEDAGDAKDAEDDDMDAEDDAGDAKDDAGDAKDAEDDDVDIKLVIVEGWKLTNISHISSS